MGSKNIIDVEEELASIMSKEISREIDIDIAITFYDKGDREIAFALFEGMGLTDEDLKPEIYKDYKRHIKLKNYKNED